MWCKYTFRKVSGFLGFEFFKRVWKPLESFADVSERQIGRLGKLWVFSGALAARLYGFVGACCKVRVI